MPLGANPRRNQTWQPVVDIDRFKKSLAFWKRRYLSIGEKITLIKSTLSNLPVNFMSLFKIPITVANLLEKIQRQFLWVGGWGGRDKEDKRDFIFWDGILLQKARSWEI